MKRSLQAVSSVTLLCFGATVADPDDTPALPSIPFNRPGDYEFHFRQTHRREMTLMLEVQPAGDEPQRTLLTHLQTVIAVSLTDQVGRRICSAVATPADGMTENHWVLRTGFKEAAFWHRNCAEIKLKRSEVSTLTISIRDVDPKTPKVKLAATLERSDDFGP